MDLRATFEKVTDWLVGGGYEEPYPIGEMGPEDISGVDYGIVDNTALKPVYEEPVRKTERHKDNVKRLPGSNYKNHEVRISEPRSFRDVTEIVQQLLDNRTVILNLHLLDKDTAQKTIDFVCGATFAIDGKVKKVGDTVFIFTPNCVQLSDGGQETASFGTDSFWGNL